MKYRHEWKHEISCGDMLILRQRLSAVMKRDVHAIDGKYLIRSLYFDNASDKALREKIDGVNIREKFRIRYYNNDTSMIHLEKKSKVNGLCRKDSVTLTKEQAQAIINGDYAWMVDSGVPLIQELYSKIMSQGLRSKTIVDYLREPFVFAPGNVRVTIDYNPRLVHLHYFHSSFAIRAKPNRRIVSRIVTKRTCQMRSRVVFREIKLSAHFE